MLPDDRTPPGIHHPAAESGPSPSVAGRRFRLLVCGAWAIAVTIVLVRVVIQPARQSVYTVDYAPAAIHWLHGQEVYASAKHFIYSPLTAAALVPFAVLGERAGNIAWRLASVAVFLYVAWGWLVSGLAGAPLAARDERGRTLRAASLLMLMPLCIGNVNNGQINLAVFAAAGGAVLAVRRERWNIAALLMAAAAFLKIYPLAVGLLLTALFPAKLVVRLAVALALFFGLSLVLQRPTYAWSEYRHWFAAMGADDRLEIDLSGSWRDFGFLLRACGVAISPHAYRIMEVGAGGVLAVFMLIGQRIGHWPRKALLAGSLYLGCAWMMLFGPATESATYVVLAAPVCAACVSFWARNGRAGFAGPRAIRAALLGSYALLLAATVGNSWADRYKHHLYPRAMQPVAALLFASAVVGQLCLPTRETGDGGDKIAARVAGVG